MCLCGCWSVCVFVNGKKKWKADCQTNKTWSKTSPQTFLLVQLCWNWTGWKPWHMTSMCFFFVVFFQKSSKKKEKEKQTCKGCNESFNFTKRKHHCKSCGAVSTDGTRDIWALLVACRNIAMEREKSGNKWKISFGQLTVNNWVASQRCFSFSPSPSAGHLCKVFKDFGQQNESSVPGVFRGQPQPGDSLC